jgi:phage N-6-adenine-methyltransferase
VKADTNDRRTPRWFFDQCEARYGKFAFDAAASSENALCSLWLGPDSHIANDSLKSAWPIPSARCAVWLNPPYGPAGAIEQWITKARLERDERGTRTLLLLPADTSTRWYHDVSRTELIELVPFRLKFDGPDGVQQNTAKFGSVLVWIAPKIQRTSRRK